MEDLERELGPLVDEFNKKVSDIKTEDEDRQKRQDQLKNNFGNLTNDIIKPVMNQFKAFLENKGHDCDVIIYPVTTSGVDPKVSLRIHTKNLGKYISENPTISFYPCSDRVCISRIQVFKSGGTSESVEGSYEVTQITSNFVKDKISNYLESTFIELKR